MAKKECGKEKNAGNVTARQYEYDNGEIGVLYKYENQWHGKKVTHTGTKYLANKSEAMRFVTELYRKTKAPAKKGDVDKFRGGLKHLYMRIDDCLSLEEKRAANIALMRMLNSCGTGEEGRRTMVQILSAGLAGYLFRLCSERDLLSTSEPVVYMTAPRLICSKADGAADALRLIMRSIGLDTAKVLTAHADEGAVESCLPVYLPSVGNERRIIDCAYAQVCKGKQDGNGDEKYYGEVLAAQYRDTVVGVNTTFFRGADVEDFVRRNRWVTIIQLGGKCELVAPIWIDGKALARAWQSDGWNVAIVQKLIRDFLIWLRKDLYEDETDTSAKRRLKENALCKLLHSASQDIDKHNQKRGTFKYRGLQRLWLEVQMMVLQELALYLVELGLWTPEDYRQILGGWLYALLPSIYPAPVDNLPVDDPKHHLNCEADSQKLFRKLLAAMVAPENCKHFMAVQAKGECPMKKADGTDVWGYVRGFQITGKDGHRYRVPTLQIREDVLTAAASMLMPLECDWRTVIKTVREQQPSYLVGKSKNVRLPVDGESRLCATLVLSIEKLAWLPKTAQNVLLELTMLIASQN